MHEEQKKEEPQDIVKVIYPKVREVIIDLSSWDRAEETRTRLHEDGQCHIEPGRTCLLHPKIRSRLEYSNYCIACVDRINTIQRVQLQMAAMGNMAKLTAAEG